MDHQDEKKHGGAEPHQEAAHESHEKPVPAPKVKRPLHKHIWHHSKRIHRNLTKYLYERDTVLATLWVFIFIFSLHEIPLNLGTLNPIKLALKDFDMNDLSYAKLNMAKNTPMDSNIVVVNIGEAKRGEIAMIIDKAATYHPKVMALDAVFDSAKTDDLAGDSMLNASFRRNKNLVVGAKYIEDTATEKLILTRNYFKDAVPNYGFVNFPSEENETIRYFTPIKEQEGSKEIIPSFTAAILKQYKPEAYERFVHHGDHETLINYTRRPEKYLIYDASGMMLDQIDSNAFKGKILLLAYVNFDPNNIEDKKFTPMNEKFYGKSVPDMNGIFVHANIISMALEDNYIKHLPLWLTILLPVLICWLHMSFFLRYYLENHIWFHLVAKIAQVASVIFFVWLGIYLFDKYRLKVDFKLSLVVIIMAVDVIYFYEAWAVWMHKKFAYRTVFKPHHH